uniref:Retrovirus-related Pol polyprotein from transposon opus n=1 Tax=Cajanus cajan TaxID=3821 RepID=A0A151SU76_CAJCA|nr:Retrovirus-related Pol polyprotein from transposon opus [Cajanus cajan]
MHPQDEEKMAFITETANYCYRVMPFGLKNAGATYQRLMNKIFHDQIGRCLEVYVDDMVVKSGEVSAHVHHLAEVFRALRQHRMRLNPEKCVFGVSGGKFLGFMLSSRGIESNPDKCQAILEMKSPGTLKEVQRFIERFGTHVIVGVSMGGKDVLYIRQEDTSHLGPRTVQKLLEDTANMKFTDSAGNHSLASEDLCKEKVVSLNIFIDLLLWPFCMFCWKQKIIIIKNNQKVYHSEWLKTIDSEPDAISMFLLPLTSLLSGIGRSGYVSNALNFYLRYKPPIEDLHQFLDFQLPRQWAPLPSEIRVGSNRKHKVDSWIQFSASDPKLYINSIPVDVGNRPVVGLRLQLEGRSSDRLAIHLQHLTSLPKSLIFSDHAHVYLSCDSYSCNWHKKVKQNSISYICTAPVESDDSASIVTGAQLHVENKCLFLRLRFSKVIGYTLKKVPEWDQSSGPDMFSIMYEGIEKEIQQKGIGCLASLIQGDVTIGSASNCSSRPAPVRIPELLRFIGTEENNRGPKDTPGYWVVSGAKLFVQHEKICLRVKYSLFDFKGR